MPRLSVQKFVYLFEVGIFLVIDALTSNNQSSVIFGEHADFAAFAFTASFALGLIGVLLIIVSYRGLRDKEEQGEHVIRKMAHALIPAYFLSLVALVAIGGIVYFSMKVAGADL